MKRILLHAGLPKTGTTSIQDFLADEAAALAEARILYPRVRADLREAGRARGIGIGWHSALTRLVSQQPGALAPGEWEAWQDEFARFARDPGLDTLLLSQEGMLINRKPEGVSALLDALPEGKREVVLVLRPALGWLTSLYEQLVRGGEAGPPETFKRAQAYLEKGFIGIIRTIRRQLPGADIRLLSFEDLSAGEGLLANFSREIGLPAALVERAAAAPRRNAGMPQDMVAVLRACNVAGTSLEGLVAIRAALARAARRRSGKAPRGSVFPPDMTAAILERYEADRAILKQRFGLSLRPETPPPSRNALHLTAEDWQRLRAEAAPFLDATGATAWDAVAGRGSADQFPLPTPWGERGRPRP
jgi:hypothetical protein